mmetsp:Transcript_60813/g.135509  ORF Transcript_60813/g.135509 Transcript_60813/m.135509 type:complete len:221 (-) Transcript_60813:7-669(-)
MQALGRIATHVKLTRTDSMINSTQDPPDPQSSSIGRDSSAFGSGRAFFPRFRLPLLVVAFIAASPSPPPVRAPSLSFRFASKSSKLPNSLPSSSAYMMHAESSSIRSFGMTNIPSFFVSTFSNLESTWSPLITRPKMVYLPSKKCASPKTIEKEEVPVCGSSNFPMESTPRSCGMSENSSGTVFEASSASAGFIRARRPPSTPWICATNPLSTLNISFVL